MFNEDFKLAESREFKNNSANQSFTMSPSRWINMTNAIGFVSKRGKYDRKKNISQKERLEKLNNTAKKQLEILINDKNIVGLEKYNNSQILITEKNKMLKINIWD